MANMNINQLVSSMSPWQTFDDEELIHNDDSDGDEDPIWKGFGGEEGRDEWTSDDAIKAFIDLMKKGLQEPNPLSE